MATNVYLYGDESACKSVLYPIFTGEEDYKIVGACSRETDVLRGVSGAGTDVLVVYVDGSDAILRGVQQVYALRPGIIIVGIVAQSAIQDVRTLSSGIQYAYDERMSKKQVLEQLHVVLTVERSRMEALSGAMVVADTKYVGFISAKDGVGKTTALVNTAVALAKCNKKVVVVDCDLLYGDVGCYFGIDSGNNDLGELLQEVGEPTIDDIRQHLVIHESGVNVLCGPRGPEIAEKISPAQVSRVLMALRGYYDYVLVDTGTTIDDTFIAISEAVGDIFVCVRPDIAVLKHTKTLLSLMHSLGMASKMNLVISFVSPDMRIATNDVVRVLKTNLAFEIPYDWVSCCSASNNGVPITLSAAKNPVSRAVIDYAVRMTGAAAAPLGPRHGKRGKKSFGGSVTPSAAEAGQETGKRRGLFGLKKGLK